jgi:hypothetical protein
MKQPILSLAASLLAPLATFLSANKLIIISSM